MIETTEKTFQLKGSLFTLTCLQVLSTDLDAFAKQLSERIEQAPKFFRQAPIIIDLNALESSDTIDLSQLIALLKQHYLVIVGIRSSDASLCEQASALRLGIFGQESKTQPRQSTTSVPASDSTENQTHSSPTLMVTEPVRSGQQIYAKGADLIVMSSVSQGAELLADGHIHVYGSLRGRALAGVYGNEEARIFSLNMKQAELISIAGHYLVNDALIQLDPLAPTQVSLDRGRLRVQSISSH